MLTLSAEKDIVAVMLLAQVTLIQAFACRS
jgi:hypothetical protein